MYFLDSNIILEYELEQEKSAEAKRLLVKVKGGEVECLTTDFHVYAGILIIQGKYKDVERLNRHISSLISYEGLTLYRPTQYDWLAAVGHMRGHRLDFDDALAYQSMRANNLTEMISYDRDFDRIKDVKRIEPNEIG